ncbi:MAG: flagellar hook-length control protein FliK [Thermodesulfobacteriota bacterium]
MQILPMLNPGGNKLSLDSVQSVQKSKNSGFMQQSLKYSGQANAFSEVFANMNAGMEHGLNAEHQGGSRIDFSARQEDFTSRESNSCSRENIANTSREREDYTADNAVKREDSAYRSRTRSDAEGKESSAGISENNINNRTPASSQVQGDKDAPEIANANQKSSSGDKARAIMQEGDAQKREKLAKAIDKLQKMGVDRKEIENALKSLEEVDLQDMQDLKKLVMQLLQEKLEKADRSDLDMSFIESFLQNLGMDGEKLQKALDKLNSGKEQEFIKLLQKFLQEQKSNTDIDVKKQDLMKLLQSLDLSAERQKGIRQAMEQLDKENLDRRDLVRILDRMGQKLEGGKEVAANRDFSPEFRNWLKNQGLSEQEINKLEQMVQKNSGNSKAEKSIQQALQDLQSGNQDKREEISQLKNTAKNNSAQGEKGVLNQTEAARQSGKGKSSEGSFLQRVQQVKSALENSASANNSGSGGKEREGSSAWKEMWGKINNSSTSKGASSLNAGQNMQEKANSTMQQILDKNSGSGKLSQNQEMRANVLKQVQNGLLRNLNQGGKELTMRLHPPHLGKLNVTLQVQNQEVSALIKSSSAEVSKMIHNQMAELKHVLEQQGLRVQKLEVQTQVPQDDASKNWFTQEEHNQASDRREQKEKRSMRNHWLAREDEEDMAQSLQNGLLEEKNALSAISVIA